MADVECEEQPQVTSACQINQVKTAFAGFMEIRLSTSTLSMIFSVPFCSRST